MRSDWDAGGAHRAPIPSTKTIVLPELIKKIFMDTAPPLAKTILVAEDHIAVRTLCRIVLAREGYRILEATDGRRALEVAEGHQGSLDLLLSDVTMPDLDGPDLARKLIAARPETRVVFMSAYPSESQERLGEYPFVQKPFQPSTLINTIREALSASTDSNRSGR
jgi:CheY-like chemotaxis protein